MKERPILFSGPMVRAILEGRKTQTRRMIKPQPHPSATVAPIVPMPNADRIVAHFHHVDDRGVHSHELDVHCPYGVVGDRLWVREIFSIVPCSAGCEKYPLGFDPTKSSASQLGAPSEGVRYKATWDRSHGARWRPSIHMPRWASRITLEIVGVRIERLNQISEADAVAEGATYRDFPAKVAGKVGPADGSGPMREFSVKPDGWSMVHPVESDHCLGTARYAFANLWDSINGSKTPKHLRRRLAKGKPVDPNKINRPSPGSWDANPWVWVIEFCRVPT